MQQYGLVSCPKCGGKRVAVEIGNAAYALSIRQPQHDPGWIGNKNVTALQASTCTQCGYVEFYAREPEKIVPDA